MNRRRFLLQSAGLAAVPMLAGWSLPAVAQAQTSLFQSSFPDLNGQSQPMSQWLGRPVVINFWATWCPPCVKEMPDLDALSKRYPQVGFVGLGVDTHANMQKFLQKVQVSYPVRVLGYGGIDLMKQLGNKAGGLPFTLVYNADGKLVDRILGQIKPQALDQTLAGLSA
jgi:thiol-disulfide isomerase/thioredoxin